MKTWRKVILSRCAAGNGRAIKAARASMNKRSLKNKKQFAARLLILAWKQDEFEIVGEGTSASDAVCIATSSCCPDVMLLDVSMPGDSLSAVREITGRAGDAFMEDTFGLHKGQLPRKGIRLLAQFRYSVTPSIFRSPIVVAASPPEQDVTSLLHQG